MRAFYKPLGILVLAGSVGFLLFIVISAGAFNSGSADAGAANMARAQADNNTMSKINAQAALDAEFAGRLAEASRKAELPADIAERLTRLASDPGFRAELAAVLAQPAYLRALVDPWRALPADFSPPDLVALEGGFYRISRNDLRLRRVAAVALDEMARAAHADGLWLVASSSYRSYDYQAQVHERLVSQMGREAAMRVSARPGHSQHQTGLVLDFGSIDNSFARTAEGIWMAENSGLFGWSLSYPDGMEHITGYSWESWHFRYLGRELARFKERHFEGVQQFALRFLYEWELLL